MSSRRVVVVGGGAAGLFGAITCAEAVPGIEVIVLEKSPHLASKIRISGGGRCNVTHACFDPKELSRYYPRGHRELIAPFHRFQPNDCIEWFEARGVRLKTEADGRVFPTTDSSQTIVDCLLRSATRAGVQLQVDRGLQKIKRIAQNRFHLELSDGADLTCDAVLLATGGCRAPAMGVHAESLGHTLEPPVPSLFSFQLERSTLVQLAGASLESVEASVPQAGLRERGALLITHQGLSGPVILKLSAWGARVLHGLGYRFRLRLNWLPHWNRDELARQLLIKREQHPSRLVLNTPLTSLTTRLWEKLVLLAGVTPSTRWASLSRSVEHRVLEQLTHTELDVLGKSLNKEEFVTCGGVRLNQVNFQTMQSKVCPGLFFAGELLDIDGLTGGFNFQAAWTTGWIAGKAMAAE